MRVKSWTVWSFNSWHGKVSTHSHLWVSRVSRRKHGLLCFFCHLSPPLPTCAVFLLSSSASFLWDLESSYLGMYRCNKGHQLFWFEKDQWWRVEEQGCSLELCPKPVVVAVNLPSLISLWLLLFPYITKTASKALFPSLLCSLPLLPSCVSFHPFKTKGM